MQFAQIIFQYRPQCVLVEVDSLVVTTRGQQGFGSTGLGLGRPANLAPINTPTTAKELEHTIWFVLNHPAPPSLQGPRRRFDESDKHVVDKRLQHIQDRESLLKNKDVEKRC